MFQGRMGEQQKQQILEAYRSGEIQVLCACDILNEGWDSPETEVLLMARPTLSKVVYVQQLGRGTRKAPGKDCLLVFDFIDNTSRYAQAMSAHRLFKKAPVSSWGSSCCSQKPVGRRSWESSQSGKSHQRFWPYICGLKNTKPSISFVGKTKCKICTRQANLKLNSVLVKASCAVGLRPENSLQTIQFQSVNGYTIISRKTASTTFGQQFKIEPITKANIKAKFFEFVEQMDRRYSYKPVLLLGLLQLADEVGRVHVPDLVQFFKQFYTQRLENGQIVEQPTSRMARIADLTDSDIERIMLAMPFEKIRAAQICSSPQRTHPAQN